MNTKIVSSVLFAVACCACSGVDTGGSGSSPLASNDPADTGSTGSSSDGCFWDLVTVSSADECEDDSVLADEAEKECEKSGDRIAAFEGDEVCGKGKSQQAKLQCCPVSPPLTCFSVLVGDDTQCSSDAELEKLADETCGAKNAKVADFHADEACPNVPPEGSSHTAKVTCCY